MVERIPIPEQIANDIIIRSSNACCICQTPYVQIHHIDENPSNNDPDNLIPLCPNHHAMAGVKSPIFRNLGPQVLKEFRDKWYSYCEARRIHFVQFQPIRSGLCVLKVKNLARSAWAQHSWTGTFASLNEEYKNLKQSELIDRAFSTTNPGEIKVFLETIVGMYDGFEKYESSVKSQFEEVCNCYGFAYFDGKIEALLK